MDTCRALSITKSWWGHLISQQNHVLVRSALVDTGRALSITSLVSTFIRTGIDICSISYRNLIRFIFVYISHYLILKLYISSRDHRTIEKLTYRYWACLITSPRGHHFHPSPTYDVSVFICIPASLWRHCYYDHLNQCRHFPRLHWHNRYATTYYILYLLAL